MNRKIPNVDLYLSTAKKLGISADNLVSILVFDGMPIAADNIFRQIKSGV